LGLFIQIFIYEKSTIIV